MTQSTGRQTVSRRVALHALGMMGSATLLGCGADATLGATADASLSGLNLSNGTLSPVFASGTTAYSASVASGTSSLTVTPTAAAGATIRVNGSAVSSGAASGTIDLLVGANAITVLVTSEDGNTTRVYSVVVTRLAVGSASCTIIPQETDGPFPLYSVLSNAAMRRADIRETRTGVPLTLTLTLVNVNLSCGPIANAAVYIWHCDKDGAYSGYSSGANGSHAGETFLRGILVSDANGQVTFTTIYPGWYAGRITHIHVEVFLQNDTSVTAQATTQVAFPQAVTQAVYNSSLYAAHGQNSSVASFAADNVFSDGETFQLANISGDVASGYAATLTIGVAA